MLQNAVVLYRSTITFSYTVSTNQSRLRIPTDLIREEEKLGGSGDVGGDAQVVGVQVDI